MDEYNDVSYEEYMFEQVNQTKEDEEVKDYKTLENVEDFDDVEKKFVDNESKPIDPNLLDSVFGISYIVIVMLPLEVLLCAMIVC